MRPKLITSDIDYAIRAILYIVSRRPAVVSVAEIVQALKTPRPFLRKILQRLNQAGLLSSYKGKGGGFLLSKGPHEIHLSDVTRVFQGEVKYGVCTLRSKICPEIKKCKLKKKIDQIEQRVNAELYSTTIASLA